jgi:lipopolysaccharide biosynthesis glycosyltransferase
MEKQIIYHITCNTDNNYAQHCCVMLCSLFENNKELSFHVHILTHGLSSQVKDIIKKLVERYNQLLTIYNIDESKLEGVKFRKDRPLTKAAYYRILLPEVLDSSIEKVFYLDCDIVVLNSVRDIYEIDLSDYPLAACEDPAPYTALHRRQLNFALNDRAFCSGVMMVNLKYWREHGVVAKLLNYSKKDREVVYLHDQDSLNYVFKGKWFKLTFKWGKTPMSIVPLDDDQKNYDLEDFLYHPTIIHYASPLKPWSDVWFPERKYYNKYLTLSQFPNPKIQYVEGRKKTLYQLSVLRYFANRYVRPWIPKLLEIITMDILNILKLLYTAICKPKMLNKTLFKVWYSRYR